MGLALATFGASLVIAQEDPPRVGVRGFLDEDGDGFNDLIPDSDGDGVPNPIDPDWRAHRPDSAGPQHGMRGHEDSTRMGNGPMMMGPGFMFMEQHGEHGMYGPGDSTMHGGMMPDSGGHMGGGHGGWPPPDSGGHHGGGGMGPGPERREPSEREKEIRITPGDNGEANRLAVPLRDIFKDESVNK